MIVGISGKAGSGKNAVGEVLDRNGYLPLAFADALKATVKDLFRMTSDQVNTQAGKAAVDPRYGMSPREILQAVGVALRGVYPDIWVRYVLDVAAGLKRVVITDVRFPNEADAIIAAGGRIVRVERPGQPVIAQSTHISETALDSYPNFCSYIVNDGTLADLRKKVETQLLPLLAR